MQWKRDVKPSGLLRSSAWWECGWWKEVKRIGCGLVAFYVGGAELR